MANTELTLPSGKNVKLALGKGYHLLNAQRKAKTSEEITFALIAELAEIDGQSVVYEDLLEFDLEDVLALQAEISGKFLHQAAQPPTATTPEVVGSLQPNASSTSQKQPAGNTAK